MKTPDRGLKPIRPLGERGGQLKRDRVVCMIIDAFRAGAYADGDRLPPERALAAEIGVSRSIVSAAIDELEEANVVAVRRGRQGGTFVVSASNIPPGLKRLEVSDGQALEWLLEARQAVELATVTLASQRAQLSDIRELRRLHDHLATLVDQPRAFAETGFTLVNRIAETTQNPFLIEMVRRLINETATIRAGLPTEATPEQFRAVHGTFGLILDAIVSGDADDIRRAVSAHIAGVRTTSTPASHA
jgi:DNA-binding FadR family transcriptional regulator